MDYRDLDAVPQDQTINCVDCDMAFTFSAGEQQYYREKELNTPKRCKNCRDARKREREHSQ